MLPKFKSIADIKWYLYISSAKLRMLYDQIYRSDKVKSGRTLSVNVGIAKASARSDSEGSIDRDDMLRLVIDELENRELVGTVDQPKDYFKGAMPMRWGLYNDHGHRPDDEPPLVYFGGFDSAQKLLVGLGGSTKHVIGHDGATSTYSRSSTPALVRWLFSGMRNDKPPDLPEWWDMRAEEDEVYQAMAIAQHYLRPPTQELEFFAKTLVIGEAHGCAAFIGADSAQAILGTPLFVAQSHPLPDDNRWGLNED